MKRWRGSCWEHKINLFGIFSRKILGQAQKELFHNEALQALDTLVAPAVEGPPANDPPSEAMVGRSYLLADAPTGDWSGHPSEIASYTNAGWRFHAPNEGMTVFVRSMSVVAVFRTGGWEIGKVRAMSLIIDGNQVVGPRGTAIPDPQDGSTVDVEARSTLVQILGVLRQHGLISV